MGRDRKDTEIVGDYSQGGGMDDCREQRNILQENQDVVPTIDRGSDVSDGTDPNEGFPQQVAERGGRLCSQIPNSGTLLDLVQLEIIKDSHICGTRWIITGIRREKNYYRRGVLGQKQKKVAVYYT